MKHGERRRSGRKVLTDDFEHLPAAAALAYNLTKPHYIAILCGSIEKLPEAFAKLDMDRCARASAKPSRDRGARKEEPQAAFASLPHADREIVRAQALRTQMEAAARSRAPRRVALG